MSRVFLGLFVLFAGTSVRADEVPRPVQDPNGNWHREAVWTVDNVAWPTLTIDVKNKRLYVGGSPPCVFWNPGPTEYTLMVPKGARNGEFDIVVADKMRVRLVRLECTVEKDTLTIRCLEEIPAGPWLGNYNISGSWKTLKTTLR